MMAENWSEDTPNELGYDDNNEIFSIKDMKCILCNKIFSTMSNMRRHIRNVHKEDTSNLSANTHMKCPVCLEVTCARCVDLYKHLSSVHRIRLEIEHKAFANKHDFEKWKCRIEDETNSFFKSYGMTRFIDGTQKTSYHCSRNGISRGRGNGRGGLQAEGSKKINAACPAKVTVITDVDRTIKVEFIKTHCGHVLDDLKHSHLMRSEKFEFSKQHKMETDSSEITDESSSNNNKQLLTRKDINNIKRGFKMNNEVDNKNNFVEVQLRVDNNEYPQECDVQIPVNEISTFQKQEIIKSVLLQSARRKFEELFAMCDSIQLAAKLNEIQEQSKSQLIAIKDSKAIVTTAPIII